MLKRLIIAGNIIAFVAIAIAALALKQTKTTRRPVNNRSDVMIIKARRLESKGAYAAAQIAYEAVIQMPSVQWRTEAERARRRLNAITLLRARSVHLVQTAAIAGLMEALSRDGADNLQVAQLLRLQLEYGKHKDTSVLAKIRRVTAPLPWADWLLARLAFDQGKLDMGHQHLAKVINAVPGFGPAYHLRGEVSLRQNNPQAAIKAFKKAFLYDGRSEAMEALGSAQRQAGKHGRALATLRTVVQKNGLTPSLVDSIGRTQGEVGAHREAAATYRKGAEVLSMPRFLLSAAEAHGLAGQRDEARSALHRLLNETDVPGMHNVLRAKALKQLKLINSTPGF